MSCAEHLSRPVSHRGGERGKRGNLKKKHRVQQASIQHTGESKFLPPHAPCAVLSPSAWHIPCGWHGTLCRADTMGNAYWEYWEYQEYWEWHPALCVCHVPLKFQCTWHSVSFVSIPSILSCTALPLGLAQCTLSNTRGGCPPPQVCSRRFTR